MCNATNTRIYTMITKELPTHLGGYQCVENGVVEEGDIWVRGGEIEGFVRPIDIGCTVTTPTHSKHHSNLYRHMPVPKQGDLDHPTYSMGDPWEPIPISMRGDLDHRGATFGEMIGMSDKRVPKEYQKPAPKEEAQSRKERPVASGVLDYFPDALMEVAYCSYVGNEQHNKGKTVHWDRSKSCDESDALIRHFLKRGTIDSDGVSHSAKVAWRALALLQKEIESSK
jgi:hypothetical protein